jgi:restriction system-associated AAA family ATPase
MKLIRLKLLSEFRGLAKGFEIKFTNNKINPKSIEPICLIGLNGSGKSNVLEVISEIFYYLETFKSANKNDLKKYNYEFGFEIEYILPKSVYLEQINTSGDKNLILDENYQMRIFKECNKTPFLRILSQNELFFIDDIELVQDALSLPSQIIGYSSGMNELISNPYIKIDFQYLDDFDKFAKDKADLFDSIEDNRLFFMDYDANKLITICNFLFDTSFDEDSETPQMGIINLNSVKEELKLEKLYSFSLSIKLKNNNSRPIKIPSFLNLAIENLKKCSTIFDEIKIENKEPYTIYEFYFYVDDITKQLFKNYFKSPRELFKIFYYLRLLNNHLIGKDTQYKIKNTKENINISSLLPNHEESKKVFNISHISFKKNKIEKPVYYKQLSDGEHQFLHVIGTLLLMDKLGTLFLFDEPETHFNPEWRSKFVSIINDVLFDKDISREQELILTTHSPFIVSDCQKENVYIFEKDSSLKVKSPRNPLFQTFGTSIEMIYWNVFQKQQSISNVAKSELNKIETKIKSNELNKEQAIDALRKFGDSFEKMNIIKLLREKYK